MENNFFKYVGTRVKYPFFSCCVRTLVKYPFFLVYVCPDQTLARRGCRATARDYYQSAQPTKAGSRCSEKSLLKNPFTPRWAERLPMAGNEIADWCGCPAWMCLISYSKFLNDRESVISCYSLDIQILKCRCPPLSQPDCVCILGVHRLRFRACSATVVVSETSVWRRSLTFCSQFFGAERWTV